MIKRAGFTLLEVLVAISISGFIVMGLFQGYRTVDRYLRRTRSLIDINRRATLLFNQIERDFSTAIMGPFAQLDSLPTGTATAPAKEKGAEKPKEQLVVFSGTTYEGSEIKIGGVRYELCKRSSFITGSPLTVFGENPVRLVRIQYELEKDKEASARDRDVYRLIRRETDDIRNKDFKQKEPEEKGAKVPYVRNYVVGTNIKALYLAYIFVPPKDETQKAEKTPPEEQRLFSTTNTKLKLTTLPQRVDIRLILWNDQYDREMMFECSVPIIVPDIVKTDKTTTTTPASAAQPPPQQTTLGTPQSSTGFGAPMGSMS